jgi:hypothetical protein
MIRGIKNSKGDSRVYGPDGLPEKDTHVGHPHHHPEIEGEHEHDWGFNENGEWKPGAAHAPRKDDWKAVLVGVGLVVVGVIGVVALAVDDATGIGAADDWAVVPLIGLIKQGYQLVIGG